MISAEIPGEDAGVAWARRPGPRMILAQARERFELGHRGDRVTVGAGLTDDQRVQVGRLLGLRWVRSGKPVTLGMLRRALRSTAAPTMNESDALENLLVRLGGSIRDVRSEEVAAEAERELRRTAATAQLVGVGVAVPVAETAVAGRWLGPPDDQLHVRAARVAAAWVALPALGRTVLLATLASTALDSPHDLDRDTETGRAVARLLAATARHQLGEDPARTSAVTTAASWRDAWASAGVLCDRVSSTVLVLNLRLEGTAPAVSISRAGADGGEPCWLTMRSLLGDFGGGPGLCTLRVCENPAVVEAAADELGRASAPLVCTYGRPSAAAMTLLGRLAEQGWRLLVSADRDLAGRQIAAELLALRGAQPWCPDVVGLYEEDRLTALVADLGSG